MDNQTEDVQTQRLKTDCNIFIDRAIQMLKEEWSIGPVAGYNGIVSLLQYAKESHAAAPSVDAEQEAKRRYPEEINVEKSTARNQRKNQRIFIEGAKWQQGKEATPGDDELIVLSKKELSDYSEWLRANGNRFRGNLQLNGIELYYEYLKTPEWQRRNPF